jgi:CHAT domain-containing protein
VPGLLPLLLATLSGLIAPAPFRPAPFPPRAVVRLAAAAVRGDSVTAVRTRWQTSLAHDSSDRAATLGLATLARLTYDYPLAERLYRRLVPAASGKADGYTVYARLGLAQGYDEYGSMADIKGLLADALRDARAIRDRAAEGEALLWVGYVGSRSAGLETALAYYDSALRVLPRDAPDLEAATRCRRAHTLVVLGRGERAARLASATALARRVGEPRALAPCIRARAIALGHRGHGDSAAVVYREFADVLRRAHDRSGRALALVWEATSLREDLADYGDAREVLAEAQVEAVLSHNQYAQAVTQLFLGQLYLALNDYRAASGYLDQAVAASAAVGDSEALNVSRSWRALVNLAAGDYPSARKESLETLEFFRREGDVENQSEVVQTLANIAIRERDWLAAERALDSSETLLRRLGTVAWRVEQPLERGRLALYRGDSSAAGRAFSRYLEGLDTAAHLQRYEARAYLADTDARQGKLKDAEKQLAAGADELDRWRATLSARDLRVTAFQANASAQNDRNASFARALAAIATGGRAEAAFALAERRRARELTDRLLQNAALERGEPPRGALPHEVQRVGTKDVAALLPDRTALLEFVTGALGAPTTVFVVTRTRGGAEIRARALAPADSLTGSIARFLALVARGEEASADARMLGRLLLEPAVAELLPEITRLVIVPDGALHRVPWDALRLRDGRLAVERYAIGIAPSAALVAALWRKADPARPAGARILALGDPAFPSDSSSASRGWATGTYLSAFATAGGLPRLRGSGQEVRAIARYAKDADVRLGLDASESFLERAELTGYRVVHLATHALVDDRISVRTALALAPGGGADGFVTPGELARLRLDADLVVLSACRTAGGVVVDGEGVQGLTAPLLEAGARSIVATTWRVGDESTVRLVERFYAGLSRGLPVAEALRTAKLDALQRGVPPGGWAAFTVVGDPLVVVRLR